MGNICEPKASVTCDLRVYDFCKIKVLHPIEETGIETVLVKTILSEH